MYKHLERDWHLFFNLKKAQEFYGKISVWNAMRRIIPIDVIGDIDPVVPWTTILVIGVGSISEFFNDKFRFVFNHSSRSKVNSVLFEII